jgi:hypothetical protein
MEKVPLIAIHLVLKAGHASVGIDLFEHVRVLVGAGAQRLHADLPVKATLVRCLLVAEGQLGLEVLDLLFEVSHMIVVPAAEAEDEEDDEGEPADADGHESSGELAVSSSDALDEVVLGLTFAPSLLGGLVPALERLGLAGLARVAVVRRDAILGAAL